MKKLFIIFSVIILTVFGLTVFSSTTQSASCQNGQVLCGTGCVSPRSTIGASCSSPTGGVYADQCGICGCPSAAPYSCGGVCKVAASPGSIAGCKPGQTYDPCTGCIGDASVILGPGDKQENPKPNNPLIWVDQPYDGTGELLKITKGARGDKTFVVDSGGKLSMGTENPIKLGSANDSLFKGVIDKAQANGNIFLITDNGDNAALPKTLFRVDSKGGLENLTVGTGNVGIASAAILGKIDRTATIDPLLIKKDSTDTLKLDLLRLDNDGNLTVGDPINGNGSIKANAIYSRTSGADNIWVGDNNDTLVVQGNIGIGTLNPPSQKLHVYSTTSADGIAIDGTTNPALRLMNSGVLKAFVALSTGAGAYSMDALANDLVIRTEAGSQKILFNTNGGAAGSSLAINNGNVGIGTLGSNEKLEVNGNVRLSSGTARTISIASRTSGGGDSLTVQSGGGVGSFSAGGNLNLGAGSVSGLNSLGGSVFIYPGAGVTNGNIILGHNGSNAVGNVSLGTMTSEAKLTIGGSIVGAYRNWMVNGITVGKEGDNDGAYFGIKNEGVNRQDTVIAWGDDAEETLKFLYTGSGGPANGLEAMRIDSAGRVGIGMGGVNLPSAYKLTVGGDVFVTGNIVSSATLSGPNMGRTSCQLIDSAVNGGQAYCPAGYYVAGLQNNAGNNSIIDQLICCHL